MSTVTGHVLEDAILYLYKTTQNNLDQFTQMFKFFLTLLLI